MTVILQLLVILVLTILEGFFVSAEISIISIRRSRLDQLSEDGNRRARRVRRLKDDPAAIEESARRDLGLIKPGETLVIIRDAQPPVH